MPLQNRVNPEGGICFSPSKQAIFMGNRGCLHDANQNIIHQSRRDAWLICCLQFKERRRHPLMKPGEYTELFFLDEATALAAGHRPCAECRRQRYNEFKEHWEAANNSGIAVKAADLDALLKHDRGSESQQYVDTLSGLPDGVIVKQISSGTYFLILAENVYPWSFEGYSASIPFRSVDGPFIILTPASTVNALRHGYRPELHQSAGQATKPENSDCLRKT